MKRTKLLTSFLALLGGVLPFVPGSADAAAIQMPQRHDQQAAMTKWSRMRDGLRAVPGTRQISPELQDVLRSTDLTTGLEEAVALSYAIAGPGEVDALDEIWLETLVANGDSRLISTFLVTRARVQNTLPQNSGEYLDRWLWEAQAGGGCDGPGGGPRGDNGHGNDTDSNDDSNPGASNDNRDDSDSDSTNPGSGDWNGGGGNGGGGGNNGPRGYGGFGNT